MTDRWIGMIAALVLAGMVTSARGEGLDSPAAPTDPASAMYTSQDVYNRLDTGATGAKRTGAFAEPAAVPTSGTMHTYDEIMAKSPATNANAATDADVLSGKVYWGLKSGAWGERSGTGPIRTFSDASTVVQAGYYAATNLTQVDTDLIAGNIKKDVNIFGVVGACESTYAPVPKTGQTTSYAAGDDGDLKKGVAWPNPRFTIQANTNCVLDNLTGLIWARNVDLSLNAMAWATAVTYCNDLNYGGYTDWRLPNWNELRSLGGAGPQKLPVGHPFTTFPLGYGSLTAVEFWSSTSTFNDPANYAWCVALSGSMNYYAKTDRYYRCVWPVRGGQ